MNIITPTADGSNTFYNERIGEHYHSKHGALQESKHVFIEAGLKFTAAALDGARINILEVGFGTGLNFLMTSNYATEHGISFDYTGLEAFPLTKEELALTQYHQYVPTEIWNNMTENYEHALRAPAVLTKDQTLSIPTIMLQDFYSDNKFDLIYFDAFSVQHQPEMWSDEMIAHVCSFLASGGVFVTYAITGKLKRALKSVNMKIEKLPGAPGKREMLRAVKS